MVIGVAPEAIDYYNIQVFSDRKGLLVRKTLEQIELNLGRQISIFYTNLVMCRPPGDRTPTMGEINACKDRLIAEIHAYKPKAILLLGAEVTKVLFPNSGVLTRERGKIRDYNGIPCMPVFSPGYVLMNTVQFRTWTDDIIKLLNPPTEVELWAQPREYKIITDPVEAKDLLQFIAENLKPVSYDIETTDFNPFKGLIYLHQFHVPERGTFMFHHHGVMEKVYQYFHPLTPLRVWNAYMEHPWVLHHMGIDLQNIDDGLLMYHMFDTRTKGYVDKSLKGAGKMFFGVPDWEIPMRPFISAVNSAPKNILYEYGAYDVQVTDAVCDKLEADLEEVGVIDTYKTIIKPALGFLTTISGRGFRVDEPYLFTQQEILEHEVQDCSDTAKKILGKPNHNLNSPQQVSSVLYGDLRLPNMHDGSTNEQTLQELLVNHEEQYLRNLLEYRSKQKMLTMVKTIIEQTSYDGRIHPKFLLNGTETGRLSGRDPNPQNIPRPEEGKFNLRKAFLPEEGYDLIDLDYSQLEFRVGAHYCRDVMISRFLKEDRDIHKEMAARILNKPLNEVTKQERNFAKSMVFAIMYDATVYAILFTFKKDFPFLTEELARYAKASIQMEFPMLVVQAKEFQHFAEENHYSTTLFGRKRFYNLITKENKRDVHKRANNSPIQGTASDICLLSGMRIHKECPEVKIHILVHDSIVASIPKGYNVNKLVEIMTTMPFETHIPFKVDHSIAERWGMK
jgi:DNA polymerase-1